MSDQSVIAKVLEQSARVLDTYRIDSGLIQEHANNELRITQGGYGDRHIFEMIQNGADEIAADPGGRMAVVLTDDHCYCANQGTAVTPEGAETILRMSVSRKRNKQIGRFGVGVKSVLSVTDAPEFFSVTGSFGFDRDWSRRQIHAVLAGGDLEQVDTPVLRMARPLDMDEECARDTVLSELSRWATTVVRLPLLPGAAEQLGHAIMGHRFGDGRRTEEFPAQFQLFSSHVGEVVLEDRRVAPLMRRTLKVKNDDDRRTIHEVRTGTPEQVSHWRVFTIEHRPTEDAREGAGEMHSRSTVDVSWAVPEYTPKEGLLTVPVGRGEFWSFFPTKYQVSLSGLLNAAWKTNEDRQNLLDGSIFNRELLKVAADLVVSSLSRLAPAEDPGAYLALLPQRVKEATNWAEGLLLRNVWEATARLPSLPDQHGNLKLPRDLRIHPDKLDPALLRLWAEYPARPAGWVHPSVEATVLRRGKMGFILDSARRGRETVRAWLEALVADGSPEASSVAIRILSEMINSDPNGPLTAEARQARIVLTESHGMVAPLAGKIFHRSDQDSLRDDMVYVDPRISDRLEMSRHLLTIGIRIADAVGRFQAILDQGLDHYRAKEWTQFWLLLRSAGGSAQTPLIRRKLTDPLQDLRVHTKAGRFTPMRDCLLPGPVVPADGGRDAAIAVDTGFHAQDLALFRELGLSDRPHPGHNPVDEPWFAEYREAVHAEYTRTAERPVQAKTLRIEGSPTAGPLHYFRELSDEGRAAFLESMPEESLVVNWQRYEGRRAASAVVMSPVVWLMRGHGRVRTVRGELVAVREAVGRQLETYAEVLPVADLSPGKTHRLGLPTMVDDVPPARWSALLDQVLRSTDDAFVGRSYALLARVGFAFPEDLLTRCRIGAEWGSRKDGEIAVATNRNQYKELIEEQFPALLIDEKADAEIARMMVDTWGMLPFGDVVAKEVRKVFAGPAIPLSEEFTTLRRLVPQSENKKVRRCRELEEAVRTPGGIRLAPLRSTRQGTTLLVLDSVDSLGVLEAADEAWGWGLGAESCARILEAQRKQEQGAEVRARMRSVVEASGVVDKIARLIDEDDLRAAMPEGLLDSEVEEQGREPDVRRLAEMAFNAHGEGILRAHCKDLERAYRGIAPSTFHGGDKALKFVTELGLPDSFAGAREPTPEPRETVEGPSEFPALHEYQEQLAAELERRLVGSPGRSMLSIPTGAGKTRVTAEAVIRWIRRDGLPAGPVLWIAQTEELCEQAVQGWKFVWSKVGAETQLVISRLWTRNQASPVTDLPHLVVATEAKLQVCLGGDDYEWLRNASLVIVDEAHGAISSQATELLGHLGLTASRTRCHLIGLTATPYRKNADLTRRLVQRFGDRIDLKVFDGDQEQAIKYLQDRGMLARVRHRVLAGGRIKLTADEERQSEVFAHGVLPRAAEQRLAEDHDRNQRLLDEIAGMPADWPILVFATSVAHAKFLAAKLGDRGVSAKAIDSATPPAERRKRVKDFQQGRLQVLTNYGVLTQGFDAPGTKAIVIARPTYSENVYQQMIGRGLRGPKNGGKDTCLIVNVQDNVDNYEHALAFAGFDYLWNEAR